MPCSVFWLVDEEKYIGCGIIRHRITKSIEEFGGHIGYAIRPSLWNKHYGTLNFKYLLIETNKLKIDSALVTCDSENIASKKIIEHAGGKLWDQLNTKSNNKNIILNRYWVSTNVSKTKYNAKNRYNAKI
ncbi:MAG: GNAT family N-acetyltransferase [Clostridiales bacterium]|nr:GNAT family N-acetyltransferase [Clostridiales bacterium]